MPCVAQGSHRTAYPYHRYPVRRGGKASLLRTLLALLLHSVDPECTTAVEALLKLALLWANRLSPYPVLSSDIRY